ncbi:MAG: diguanylate cyclase [Deltaproteobacteria bacterium]|nr:diguanylate cyclase [Deltaproteobacteria bacterium]
MKQERARILIVDDETFNLQFLTELFLDDYNISPVKDGVKALRLAESLVPELIILDVVMPGMDGYALIRALKENPKTRHIPVIFLTSLDSDRDEEKGLSLGAVDYIGKPFHPAIVKARVNNMLELVEHRKLVERIAMLDGLTGIPNRRAYDLRLQDEWKRACRSREPFSLAMLDIDYFKLYNDSYGHAGGDQVLRRIAGAMTRVLRRSSDFVGRYGGEEFALIMPATPGDVAWGIAERICREIRNLGIEHRASRPAGVVTISVGGATILPSPEGNLANFTRYVDQMLYLAKEKRNRAVWDDFPPSAGKRLAQA